MTTTIAPPAQASERAAALEAALEHARHLLPAQGPVGVFVHHNTLHAYQHLPFHDAVAAAHRELGGEPYLSLARYRAELACGRIEAADLEHELERALARAGGDRLVAPGLRRRALWGALLRLDDREVTGAPLRWLLWEEGRGRRLREDLAREARRVQLADTRHVLGQALEAADLGAAVLALTGRAPGAGGAERLEAWLGLAPSAEALSRALWRDPEALAAAALWSAAEAASSAASAGDGPAARGHAGGAAGDPPEHDPDDLVAPLLIRWVAAFLDHGQAGWPMPGRERGLFAATRDQLAAPGVLLPAWAAGVPGELRALAARAVEPEALALEELARRGPPASWPALVARALLALPGWAGMVAVLEARPELAPPGSPRPRLLELLALRLLLDRHAAAWAARVGAPAPPRGAPAQGEAAAEAGAWTLFEAAQLAELPPSRLRRWRPEEAARALAEARAFDDLARRRTWQLAYERRHRRELLTGIASHRDLVARGPAAGPPRVQALFCIDDREESLRRHLEELEPELETFGAAGFFGLAVRFRGLHDAEHADLCPVVLTPEHAVEERPLDAEHHARWRRRRRWLGLARAASGGQSRHLLGGLLGAVALGPIWAALLVARVFAPRAAARAVAWLEGALLAPPATRLTALRPLGRAASAPDADAGAEEHLGFAVEEAVERVGRLLEDAGLTRGFAPLVAVFGHGSSSQNNPLESAYDCGACGGRRGWPNARLFAALANHPAVRRGLAARGIELPPGTHVVGGYHDTASDAVRFFDLEAVPATHAADLRALRAAVERARALDAHERCRRFEGAPLDLTPAEALRHVEARAAHVAEPRPEYGHCTVAACLVGRRRWTRGLFLDRRAFLVSYDPTEDPDLTRLTRLLGAVGPVGAGISLEYYFSRVDDERWGCGTKLPHNLTGLLGLMNGHQGDLRTGLAREMTELHEPVRLLTVVEATPAALLEVARRSPVIAELVGNGWIQLVSQDPTDGRLQVLEDGGFVPFEPEARAVPAVLRSFDHHAGAREHLPPATVRAGLVPA